MAREIEGLDNDPGAARFTVGQRRVQRHDNPLWLGQLRPDQPAATTVGSGGVRAAPGPARRAVELTGARLPHGPTRPAQRVLPARRALGHPRELTVEVPKHSTALVWAYIDWISIYVFEVYESERNLWLGAAANIHSALIHGLLGDPTADTAAFEAQTGYRLDQSHVAAVIWSDADRPATPAAMETTASEVAATIGARVPSSRPPSTARRCGPDPAG